MGFRGLAAGVCVGVLVVSACGGDAGEAGGGSGLNPALARGGSPGTGSAEIATDIAPDLQVDLSLLTRLPSGLHMRDLEVGRGEEAAVNGRTVRLAYTAWLSNGVQFDSSREGGEPVEFTVGVGDVILGWDEGVVGMREGGRRLLVVPPALGYGESGHPGMIPPNSTLVFDIELVEILSGGRE